MLRQIKIAARGHSLQFLAHQFALFVALTEWEFVEDIHGCPGVVREFVRLLPVLDQGSARQTDVLVITESLLYPILVPNLPTPIGLRLAGMTCTGRLGHAAINRLNGFV